MLTKLTLTLFFFNAKTSQDIGGWVRTKIIEGKGPWIYQVVPIFNRQGVLNGLLNTLPIPTLELRPPLYCTKQEKESVMITANIRKLETTRRNTDAPKIGVPHQRSNLGISPQSLLEGVSKSSLDTKKNLDFQYLKDDGKPLMILVFLP